MFGQPRCREWSPLATQQLRLRSLLQIVGYNLYGNDGCSEPGSLYYTLHTTTMSAPFYTSEKLLSNHPKWREIDSGAAERYIVWNSERYIALLHLKEIIHKMSSLNVVVRVWKHIHRDEKNVTNDESNQCYKQTDKIIQTWGVYFSGLLYIGANISLDFSSKSFKENCLIFQMMGGYFCSYDKLKLQSIPKGLLGVLSCSILTKKESSPSKTIPIENKQIHRNYKEIKSASPGRSSWKIDISDSSYFSKSHSPTNNGYKNITSDRKTNIGHTNKVNYDYAKERSLNESYDLIYEHSPKGDIIFEIQEYSGSEGSSDHFKSCSSLNASNRDLTSVEESETAENLDNNYLSIPKFRYSSMKFLKSEIRPSYNAEKLRKLHMLQFSIKNRFQAVQEIKERIYQLSAIKNCDNLSGNELCTDHENFSKSENLSVSCREYSFLKGKNRNSRCKIFDNNNEELIQNDVLKIEKELLDENKSKSVKPVIENKSKKIKVNDKRGFLQRLINNTTATDRRFTLPLNKLLEFKPQPSPMQRLKYAYLTKQAELSRFKMRLLKDERDAATTNIRHLKDIRSKLFEENQDNGSDLMQKYHSLSKKWDQLKELRKSEAALRELCVRSACALQSRRWQLVQDIQIIYPIEENEEGKLFILGIHLPACQSDGDGLRQVSEADVAVALGRVAHVAALAAALLAVPLRHPIRLMGSRTKVLDQTATQQTEIPLFARNRDSMMFRYGLFLLNRNIAQLLWSTHRYIIPDPRNTLVNLRQLITPPVLNTSLDASTAFGSVSSVETIGAFTSGLNYPFSAPSLATMDVSSNIVTCSNTVNKTSHQSLRSLVAIGTDRSTRNIMVSGGFNNIRGRQFNRFKDSVDGHSPKAAMVIRRHRCSRSDGSYGDEQIHDLSPPSITGSEPSLVVHCSQYNINASENDNISDSPSENVENVSFSESDLTKVSDLTSPENAEGRVYFCVGDDNNLESENENNKPNEISKQTNSEASSDTFNINQCKDIKKFVDIKLKNDSEVIQINVNQLTEELQQLCSIYSSDVNNDRADVIKNNTSSNTKQSIKCQEKVLKEMLSTRNDVIDAGCISTAASDLKISKDIHVKNSMDDEVVEIEKLANITYCSEPCSKNCLQAFREFTSSENISSNNDDDDDETMQDVIVLPSAEAVMTSSSHFTDSLRMLDEIGVEQTENSYLYNYAPYDCTKFSDETEVMHNDIFYNLSKPMCRCNSTDLNTRRESSGNENQCEGENMCALCNLPISDCASICEGSTASRDANELLESIKLIDNVNFMSDTSHDLNLTTLLNSSQILDEENNTDVPRNDLENLKENIKRDDIR